MVPQKHLTGLPSAEATAGGDAKWVRISQDDSGTRKACEAQVMQLFNITRDDLRTAGKKRPAESEKLRAKIAALTRKLDEVRPDVRMKIEIAIATAEESLKQALIDEKCPKPEKRRESPSASVVIDRCNFNRSQRATWIKLAEAAGVAVKRRACVLLAPPPHVCCERAALRKNHPTLTQFISFPVVHNMFSEFSAPSVDEGFGHVFILNNTNAPALTDYLVDVPTGFPASFVNSKLPHEDCIMLSASSASSIVADSQGAIDPFRSHLSFPEFTLGHAVRNSCVEVPLNRRQAAKPSTDTSATTEDASLCIAHPGIHFFRPSYSAFFLTKESRERLLSIPACRPGLSKLVLDHITIKFLRKNGSHCSFLNCPCPGLAVDLNVVGVLRTDRVECFVVAGQVFGRPLRQVVASHLPHITLSLHPNAAAYESVDILQADANRVAAGTSSFVAPMMLPLSCTGSY